MTPAPDVPSPERDGTRPEQSAPGRHPLYPRLLRLRHIAPNACQRALLGEGALACAALLVLADLATAWTLVVLPLAVAAVVKAHDLVAGALPSAGRVRRTGEAPSGRPGEAIVARQERRDPS